MDHTPRLHHTASPPRTFWKTTRLPGFGLLALTLTFLFFFIGDCPAAQAAEDESRLLRVAFPEATGINEVYDDGTYGGCVYDWLKEIAKYTGWEYEFITEGTTSQQLKGLIDCEYDLMGGMYYRPELTKLYNYPKYIMGSNYSLLIYRQGEQDIKSYDYTTLNGKRIGVLKRATSKIERLQEYLTFNNISCELVYFEKTEDYINCLETGEADILLGTDVYMQEHYNVAAMIPADPYYIVTAIDEPELCQQLSEAMEAIYEANPNFATELYNKYFPNAYINSILFTPEEQAFLAQSSSLRVAVLEDRYPLLYEQEGTVKGIVPETLKLISDRTGLQFEYVYASSSQELLDLISNKQADLIGCFLDSDRTAEAWGLACTADFVTLDSVILRNKNALGDKENKVMAVPKGRAMKTDRASDVIRYYDKYQSCLEAVNKGEADYTRMPASFIEDFYARDYYANLNLVADTNLREEISFALPTPINVPLYSILNKAINNFSEEESRSILTQNTLTLPKSNVTLKTLFYSNPIMVIGISIGSILFIAIVIILLGLYRMRTKIMQMKLEKAEETSKAKSDFLSRMSHEIRTPMNAIIGLTNLTRMSGEATPNVDSNLAKIDSSAQFLLSLLNDVLDMSKLESDMMKIEAAPFDLGQLAAELDNMFRTQATERGLHLDISCQLEKTLYSGDKMRLQQVLTNLLSNACKFTDAPGAVRLLIETVEANDQKALLHFSVKDDGIGIREEDRERIFDSFEQARNSNLRAPGTGLGLAISSKMVSLMGGRLEVKSTWGAGSDFYFTIELPLYDGVLPEAPAKTTGTSLAGLHILLAEDNDLNAEIVVELLEMKAITVDRAADGQQAVDLFAASAEGAYNVILMDVNMPIKDGLTAAREIRALNRRDASTVPILAMTANTFQEDRDQAAASGMTGFLPKPFDVEQLYKALEQA